MIGVARWVSRNTCFEATFAVSYLACFLENPSEPMLKAAVQIFRYFKWTIEAGVEGCCFSAASFPLFPPGFNIRVGKNNVYGYIDATYLSEEDAACRLGIVFFINGMCVYLQSKRLPTIVLSSTEAEYIALSIGYREGKFIRMVLEAIGEKQTGPMLIGQDNKSCIAIAENPGRHHGRTKHIAVHMRYIERDIALELLALVYVATAFMVADILTEALAYEAFARHAAALKGKELPTRGSKRKSE